MTRRIDLRGLSSRDPKTKFGSAKRLRALARTRPAAVYPRFDEIARLLDHENRLLKWTAIDVIGELSSVDRRKKVDVLLRRLFDCLDEGEMITANHAISSLARIASFKPSLVAPIAAALMKVRRFDYRSPECRNIALGKVVLALGGLISEVEDVKPIVRFVRDVSTNPRPATRRKAEQLLKRLEALGR